MVAFHCTFHGPTAAAAAHVDESLEPYISLLAAREVEFMSGEEVPLDASVEDFASIWRSAVRPWAAAEEEGVRRCLEVLYTALEPYPAFARLEWRFIKTSGPPLRMPLLPRPCPTTLGAHPLCHELRGQAH